MAVKHIVVPVEHAAAEPRLEAALGLARRFGAHLTGVQVASSAATANRIPKAEDPSSVRSARPSQLGREVDSLRCRGRHSAYTVDKRFRCLADEFGVDVSWTIAIGATLNALAKHSLFADMVVVGQDDGPSVELFGVYPGFATRFGEHQRTDLFQIPRQRSSQ